MHRLLLDQNVRIEVAEALRADAHDVVRASETNLARRDDAALFRWAGKNGLTIVTFDLDFAEYAYWNHEPHAGVVRLRLEPQTPEHVMPVLRAFLVSHTSAQLTNALVILTERKVRIRRW
jgi:predicted nuclease of predicted toxin-antitoxin system